MHVIRTSILLNSMETTLTPVEPGQQRHQMRLLKKSREDCREREQEAEGEIRKGMWVIYKKNERGSEGGSE